MEDKKVEKYNMALVTVTAVCVGLLLVTIVTYIYLKNYIGPKTQNVNYKITEETISERMEEIVMLITDKEPMRKKLNVDKDSLEKTPAGQLLKDGNVLISGLTYEDFDTPNWGVDDYQYLQIQRSVRQIQLLKPLEKLGVPPHINIPKSEYQIIDPDKKNMNVHIENPFFMDRSIIHKMFTSDVNNSLMVFLTAYLDLWGLPEIVLDETPKNLEKKLFKGIDIDYTFKMSITDEWEYYIGVKGKDDENGGYRLKTIYVNR